MSLYEVTTKHGKRLVIADNEVRAIHMALGNTDDMYYINELSVKKLFNTMKEKGSRINTRA